MRGSNFNGWIGGPVEKAVAVLASVGVLAIFGFAVITCAFILQHLRFAP